MITINLSDWREYDDALETVHKEYGQYQRGEFKHDANILYRGHADNNWSLTNTLERESNRKWTLSSYAELVYRCVPQIESTTGHSWGLPEWMDYKKEVDHCFSDMFVRVPYYRCWVYLRHHGFPSPLLDWSSSPYIALFFALEANNSAKDASVFAFVETPSGGKTFGGGELDVQTFGPYVSTHRRHFLQQCWYTMALNIGHRQGDIALVTHDHIAEQERRDQNVFVKINIPRHNRIEALEKLHKYNITHSSLFQSEESLMKTMAFQEIQLKDL